MRDTDYAYAVIRIRCHETRLLTSHDFDQLLAASNEEDCVRILADHGYPAEGRTSAEMLTKATDEAWDLLRELAPELSVFDFLLYKNDFHNLKAIIKGVYTGNHTHALQISAGVVTPHDLRKAIIARSYTALPAFLRDTAERAAGVMGETRDGQLVDLMVDRDELTAVMNAAQKTGNENFIRYAELLTATADIKTALRAARLGKDAAFLKKALAPCATLDIGRLTTEVLRGQDAVAEYLSNSVYSEGIALFRESGFSALEKWNDDQLLRVFSDAKTEPFGPEPLAAYVLAKENEVRAVRLILTGKRNRLPNELIRARMRILY